MFAQTGLLHAPTSGFVSRNVRPPGTNNRQFNADTEFKTRPGFNTTGKEVKVELNAYAVTKYPDVKIYQYDITIGDGAEKQIVNRKVWNSQMRKNATGQAIIWDSNKLAWSMKEMNEIRLMVDLDADEGRPARPNNANVKRLRIAPTKILDLSIIDAYLAGRTSASPNLAEAINFMDHLLSEGPSQNNNLVAVKRSFFARSGERQDLGGGVEVFRGVYQSLRLAQGGRLIINLDVANTTFWKPTALLAAMIANNQNVSNPPALVAYLTDRQKHETHRKATSGRFKGTVCKAVYPGNPAANREWKCFRLSKTDANTEKLEWKDPQTRQPTGEHVSVAEYFRRKYNHRLQYPQLPLMEMTKKGVMFPIELLHIQANQRYAAKLDENQTANMIKFAVSGPDKRKAAMLLGKQLLNWENDVYLKNYNLQVSNDTIKTTARILPNPTIEFGGKIENPGTKGRWDLRGKKYLSTNPQELKAWGIGFMPGRVKPDRAAIERVAQDIARDYRSYGGRVANAPPHIMPLPPDAGQAVELLFQGTGNNFKMRPQLLIFLVQDKGSFNYLRIKKSADCRYGVVSQVMQIAQCMKGNPQYYGNVLMKVNAKLGGCTSRVKPNPTSGFKGTFGGPTMFIGADVSHPSPGSMEPSMAAITMSMDRHAGRYAAACQTNGHRVEIISQANMINILTPLTKKWIGDVGGNNLPKQIYYMRDGVSEGQFAHVMQQEVMFIRKVMNDITGKPWGGQITTVVASKRHHVRAYPKPGDSTAGDSKNNPLPGCLIERDVTSPREFDFFLYSHIALQGTSRPVHYTIISDEANHQPNFIQNMIYEHCYQYMRSTTSVSLHPAVYYAHLASNRAKAHLNLPASGGPTGGPGFKQNQAPSSDAPSSEAAPLINMENAGGIKFAMWYI